MEGWPRTGPPPELHRPNRPGPLPVPHPGLKLPLPRSLRPAALLVPWLTIAATSPFPLAGQLLISVALSLSSPSVPADGRAGRPSPSPSPSTSAAPPSARRPECGSIAALPTGSESFASATPLRCADSDSGVCRSVIHLWLIAIAKVQRHLAKWKGDRKKWGGFHAAGSTDENKKPTH